MSTVSNLAEKFWHELEGVHPRLRKTILKKLPMMVAVMLKARTVNTTELAEVLPLATSRSDMRLQWISRLLNNPLVVSNKIIEPFARRILSEIGASKQVIVLKMDQEKIGERFTILMVNVLLEDQAFPLSWRVETTDTYLGFDWQRSILEQIISWLPEGITIRLLLDRISPREELFRWVQSRTWQYRFYLQANLPITNHRKAVTVGGLLDNSVGEIFMSDIFLFSGGAKTNIAIIQEHEHDAPRIVAMDCLPTSAALHELERYHGVDAVFSSFCTKGFSLKDTQLYYAIRIDHMALIIALAIYWHQKIQ